MRSLYLTVLQERNRQAAIQKASMANSSSTQTSSQNLNPETETEKKNSQANVEPSFEEKKEQIQAELALDKARLDAESETNDLLIALEQKRLEGEIKLQEMHKQKEALAFEAQSQKHNAASLEHQLSIQEHELTQQKRLDEIAAKKARTKQFFGKVLNWLKIILLFILLICVVVLLSLALYRGYRWVVETPLIVEVEKIVEIEKEIEKIVEVEKEIEKIVEIEKEVEKIVEKEVIPDECTQIRRNGEIFINCDGVKVEGVPTLVESNLENVPELLTD